MPQAPTLTSLQLPSGCGDLPPFDRAALPRLLLWTAVALPAVPLAGALVADGWPAQRFLALYVAPLFAAAPLWLRLRLRAPDAARGIRAWLDGAVLLLSFLRFVLGGVLPFSGHTLFLTYSGLTTRDAWYRWLAAALVVETTVFKLWLWRDASSWALGIALGLLAAWSYSRLSPRHGRPPRS